jgi:hypothetical protein
MWLFTVHGLLSATRSPQDPSKVQIRARTKSTIDAIAQILTSIDGQIQSVIETNQSDYRYRLITTPDQWAQLARLLAAEVTYPNFKDEVHRRQDKKYLEVCHRVWGLGATLDDGGTHRE